MSRIERSPLMRASRNACTRLEIACISKAGARGTGRSEAQAREVLERRNPQRRLIAPDEVAATVAWLCQPESQSINGQAISLSGGEVMTG